MKKILLLGAAAAIVACHSSNEDQAGPAPAKATDSVTTHAMDSTRVDTTMSAPASVPQDTLGPQGLDSTLTDTTTAQ